jgi:hypothetical protein
MERGTQCTAATAEQSAAASEDLHAQAALSKQVAGRLMRMVGNPGGSGVSAAPAARPDVALAHDRSRAA